MMPTRSRHVSRSGSFDFNSLLSFSLIVYKSVQVTWTAAVIFDFKEERESDVALSQSLVEENLRRINRRRH